MRVTATVLPGLGHLNPMVPLLRTLQERGHEVEVVVPPPFTRYVERAGLRARGLGPAWTEAGIEEVHPGWHELHAPDQIRVWTEVATAFHPHLLAHVEQARPDVLVHDHWEYAAWLVGEQLGIPTVPYAMTVRSMDPTLIALTETQEAIDAMCAATDRPADGGEGRGSRWLYLDAVPSCLTRDLLPPGPTVHPVRHAADDRSGADTALPRWLDERDRGRPLVYVTLGTIYNRTPQIISRLVEGAATADADVLVTVGEDGDLLDRVPSNVVVERYVPQADLYPCLDAVVCHGGFGTAFGAIGHGLPIVCAPIAADQTTNAALLTDTGAALNLATQIPEGLLFPALGPGEPDPAVVAAASRASSPTGPCATGRGAWPRRWPTEPPSRKLQPSSSAWSTPAPRSRRRCSETAAASGAGAQEGTAGPLRSVWLRHPLSRW